MVDLIVSIYFEGDSPHSLKSQPLDVSYRIALGKYLFIKSITFFKTFQLIAWFLFHLVMLGQKGGLNERLDK